MEDYMAGVEGEEEEPLAEEEQQRNCGKKKKGVSIGELPPHFNFKMKKKRASTSTALTIISDTPTLACH